ncbi:MAG: redox-sensing transcriptional repressor Rex, partial [Oscillospiraceae bacterium]
MANYPGVSISVIRRLPRYYRFLEELDKNGVERISSKEFAQLIGVTASQIRQDLNCFGGFGQQGYGYNVRNLYEKIGSILALEKKRPTILIGAGNLGLALATHMRFEDRGFRLLGVFDNNPAKIGMPVADGQVLDAAGLEAFCGEHKPEIAILSIPKQAAVE